MSLGLIVKTGRILTARLLMGDPIEGITHCAIGEGDATFTDPINPPAPDIDQTTLKNERARKKQYKRTFLKEDPEGTLIVNGIHYIETAEETQTIGVFFRFEETSQRHHHPGVRLLRGRRGLHRRVAVGLCGERCLPPGYQPDR